MAFKLPALPGLERARQLITGAPKPEDLLTPYAKKRMAKRATPAATRIRESGMLALKRAQRPRDRRLGRSKFLTGDKPLAEVTAYNPEVGQTDLRPFETAAGTRAREGIVAVNDPRIPFGTKVKVGGKVLVVEDLLGPESRERFKNTGKLEVDIFMDSLERAKQFGRQQLEVEFVGERKPGRVEISKGLGLPKLPGLEKAKKFFKGFKYEQITPRKKILVLPGKAGDIQRKVMKFLDLELPDEMVEETARKIGISKEGIEESFETGIGLLGMTGAIKKTTGRIIQEAVKRGVSKKAIEKIIKLGERRFFEPFKKPLTKFEKLKAKRLKLVEKRLDSLIDEEAGALKGLEKEFKGGQIVMREEGVVRVSEHSPAYREVFERTGKAPTIEEWKNIAVKNLSRGESIIGLEDDFLKLTRQIEEGVPMAKIPEKVAPRVEKVAIPRELESLAKEARKFRSAEEFLEKGTLKPETKGVFWHGSSKEGIQIFKRGQGNLGEGVYLTQSPGEAQLYAAGWRGGVFPEELADVTPSRIYRVKILDKNLFQAGDAFLTKEQISQIKNQRFVGIQTSDEVIIFNPKNVKITETLTDFYNQVKRVEPRVVPPKKPKRPPSVKRILGIEPPTKVTIREDKLLREKLRVEARGARAGKIAGRKELIGKITSAKEEKEFLDSIRKGIVRGIDREKNRIKKEIGFQRHIKELPTSVQQRLKQSHGIREWKNANLEQLNAVLADMKKLERGDSFLTDKQITGLEWYIKEGKFDKKPGLITKREMVGKFKESREIMDGALTKYISNNAFPTVDVKEGHPIIRRIVDSSDIETRKARGIIKAKYETLDNLMISAEKSRKQDILKRETGERIFKKMSGEAVELTTEETKVVGFLKEYFEQARKDIGLQNYRKNYITHIQQGWMESIVDKGIFQTVQDFIKPKEADIPLDLMLALDNIIGSEKFFRFALQRKGALTPSKNIRKIFKEYSSIVETKKALDKVLPEAQASQQLLLQNKSAVWMKTFLQNLKGRALDFKFRSGKMNWVSRTGDTIVDLGYLRLLAGNVWSSLKNLVGGEINSFVYLPFGKYALGKKRFFGNPKRAYKMISELGVLEGSYVDIARRGFVAKGKKFTDNVLYGFMRGAEYEIRGSYLLGELTKKEWKAGAVSPERYRKILDGIAITQGVYTKVDSPQFAQTVLGRAVIQFGRWKITNSLLARRIATGMKSEIAIGNYTGPNSRKLIKMLVTSGIGMYLAYEAGKAGYRRGEQVAEAGAELVLTLFDMATGKLIYDALASNPTLDSLGAIVFSMQQLANSITFGIVDEPRGIKFQSGIEDMYVAGLSLLGFQKKKKKAGPPPIKLPKMPGVGLPGLGAPSVQGLPRLPGL